MLTLFAATIVVGGGIHERGVELHPYNPIVGFNCLVSAVQRWFDITSREVPIAVLREHFSKASTKVDFASIDPLVFEKLVAECLRYEYAPCEVHHVGTRGGAGDGGVDLFMITEESTWLIQVKRRLNDKTEPIETIRLLNGVLLREGKSHGMIVTSAESFSRNAGRELLAKSPGPYLVRLLDRGDVTRMIRQLPDPAEIAWEEFIRTEFQRIRYAPVSTEFLDLIA